MALNDEDKQWISDALRTGMQQLRTELRADMDQLRTEWRTDVERVETSLLTAFHNWASPTEIEGSIRPSQ